VVAEVATISDDDMIHEVEAHQLASPLELIGQVIVVLAGAQVARRVVVANGNDGGVSKDGLTHDDTDVDTYLADTSVGYAHLLDESMVLVHKQKPKLLYILVLQYRVHVVIDTSSRT